MPLRLTPDQEQRRRGAYASVDDALNAAVTAVETAAAVRFDGPEELVGLLREGMESPEISDTEFWTSVDHDTNFMLGAHATESGA